MKRLFCLFLGLALSVSILASSSKPSQQHPELKAKTVVWAGLDYSLVRMYGEKGFNEEEKIFPHFPDAWNQLFLSERIKVVEKLLKKTVIVDIEAVNKQNKKATSEQIVKKSGSFIGDTHIHAEDIENLVKSYELSEKEGLGLVYIVDRLVKPDKKGSIYIVFFDIEKRTVIVCDHYIGKAGGFGFRNYWFGVVKQVDKNLKKYK